MTAIFNSRNFKTLIAVLLVLSNIFIFSPLFIFQGNLTGFQFYLYEILLVMMIPFLFLLVMLTVIGLKLPERHHTVYVVIFTSLGILTWLQGTFVVWDLGVLDGSVINWGKSVWRGFADGALWIMILVAGILARKAIYRYSFYIGSFILISQLLMAGLLTVRKPEIWIWGGSKSNEPPKEIFEFSKGQNILHIVLDQLGSSVFEEFTNKDKSYTDCLEGFTYFKEAITSTHVTTISVPSFLSGHIYRNQEPMMDFFDGYYRMNNIQETLHDNGFELDMINQPAFLERRSFDTYYYNIPTPYHSDGFIQRQLYHAAFLFDLSMFRCSPYFIKKVIYNKQSWFASSIVLSAATLGFEHFSANRFLNDFAMKASIARSKPVYKYIHLMTPHPPLVINKDLKYAGQVLPETVRMNFIYQAEYSWVNVVKLLERLKELDLYNSTFIIIQSDHGSGVEFNLLHPEGVMDRNVHTILPSDAFFPLLLVKLPNQTGPLKISHAQVELTDLPATVCDQLAIRNSFPGQSFFKVDTLTNRKRTAYYSTVTNRNDAMVSGYFNDYQEYVVEGKSYELASWHKGGIMEKSAQQYNWGTVLNFNSNGKIQPYLTEGWSAPEQAVTWSNSKNLKLNLPVKYPKSSNLELSCNVRPFLAPDKGLKAQHVIVSINNEKIGEVAMTSPGVQSMKFRFSRNLVQNSSDLVVQFSLPDATIGQEVGVNGETRMLGLAFVSMTLRELPK